jgi:hypothetical protein
MITRSGPPGKVRHQAMLVMTADVKTFGRRLYTASTTRARPASETLHVCGPSAVQTFCTANHKSCRPARGSAIAGGCPAEIRLYRIPPSMALAPGYTWRRYHGRGWPAVLARPNNLAQPRLPPPALGSSSPASGDPCAEKVPGAVARAPPSPTHRRPGVLPKQIRMTRRETDGAQWGKSCRSSASETRVTEAPAVGENHPSVGISKFAPFPISRPGGEVRNQNDNRSISC